MPRRKVEEDIIVGRFVVIRGRCSQGMMAVWETKAGVGTCRSRSSRPTRPIVCDDGLYELAEYESSSLYDDS
jgi:hypothetical protein